MSIKVGQQAFLSRKIGDEDVRQFADLVGDTNPVHLDDKFAVKTRFGQRIAHGMWPASLISAVIGTKLPGPGTIYLHQTLQFNAPVFIDDTITATVTVINVRQDKPIVTLETLCTNQNDKIVLQGEAVVLMEPTL
jgi:acyl dehydratase